MGDDIRTGETFPTYEQSGFRYYMGQTGRLARERFFAEPGTVVHYAHRLTGLIITFYLVLHITVVSQAAFNGTGFDEMMHDMHANVAFLLMDWLLFGAVAFHGLNGIRIILFDFDVMTAKQDQLAWVVIIGTIMLMVIALAILINAGVLW